MRPALRLFAPVLLLLVAWTAQAGAQEEQEQIVSLYRVAPGQHIAFLQWQADGEAAAQEAGVPPSQWYVHHNGDSWDFISIGPVLTDAQNDAVDAASRARGLKTGAQASIELRQYMAWHTDTYAGGPMTAAELLAEAQTD